MLEAEQIAGHRLQTVEGAAAGVRLITTHDCRPLLGAHRRGAAVGQQINEDVVGVQSEDVVARGPDQRRTFLAAGHADRFDRLDLERLDDRAHSVSNVLRVADADDTAQPARRIRRNRIHDVQKGARGSGILLLEESEVEKQKRAWRGAIGICV